MIQRIESLDDQARPFRRTDSMLEILRSLRSRLASALSLARQGSKETESRPAEATGVLNVAGYTLVLMDTDGQVVWTREWDAGGTFQFGPRQRLWVSCGFTNHSESEAEISEYEVELMGEDGLIVERFNNSFGDVLIVPPGESKQFRAEWRL
jgi:hypothetical protein